MNGNGPEPTAVPREHAGEQLQALDLTFVPLEQRQTKNSEESGDVELVTVGKRKKRKQKLRTEEMSGLPNTPDGSQDSSNVVEKGSKRIKTSNSPSAQIAPVDYAALPNILDAAGPRPSDKGVQQKKKPGELILKTGKYCGLNFN